jgi:hypothetical protein
MTSRERFEAAHKLTDLGFLRDDAGYISDTTQRCWFSWQAALDSLDVAAAAHEARSRGFDCPGTVEIRAILDAAKGKP